MLAPRFLIPFLPLVCYPEGMSATASHSHERSHSFSFLKGRQREGLTVWSRRSVLKASLAGFAGLTFPDLLRLRSQAAETGGTGALRKSKAVILLWMTGGPSHIDTWDVKPDMPSEIRGPFKDIPTRLPGVHLCEYYPKQAAMMDQLTLIRSVDCRESNHEPNMVMQTANLAAEPRLNPRGHLYPAIGSQVARLHGANHPSIPPYIALNLKDRSHVAWGGYLGQQFDPFNGANVSQLFQLPAGLTLDRIKSRQTLAEQMSQVRSDLDTSGQMASLDRFTAKAFDIVAGGRAQEAFDLSKEPAKIVERYGTHDWCKQALLARRLVAAGSSFVTIDLSNHSASGTWDTHGDNIPPYGGIWSGLRPLLPTFDHLVTTLISDLKDHGMLDDTLVIAMGEFGRTPKLGTQGSTDGRDHWPYVMSMLMAGGGYRHGQVIGASTRDGGDIAERPVSPGDIAATIYHHFGIPHDATYLDHGGRPNRLVEQGEPIRELL